jgi:hypothetical protein
MNETYQDLEGYPERDFIQNQGVPASGNFWIGGTTTLTTTSANYSPGDLYDGSSTGISKLPIGYFTPDITDIRVGYECELHQHNEWVHSVLEWEYNFDGLIYSMKVMPSMAIRVPYLTREQIEGEGWEFAGEVEKAYLLLFTKMPHLYISYDTRLHLMTIFKVENDILDSEEEVLYNGPMKDINTLRYICKLLEI